MKLLLCLNCGDAFSLSLISKTCQCGQTKGKLRDSLYGEYSGNCVPIGFANSSLRNAIKNQPIMGDGEEFTAFIIPKFCHTLKKL